MTPPEPLRKTLIGVTEAMRGARAPWWVIGSAAVKLHGADPGRVADVDILLGTDDALAVLPPLGLVPAPGRPHPRFRSALFCRWTAQALPVEFMAGFECCVDGIWHSVEPRGRVAIAIGAAVVTVPERAELCAMLRMFGRDKDHARARRLDALG